MKHLITTQHIKTTVWLDLYFPQPRLTIMGVTSVTVTTEQIKQMLLHERAFVPLRGWKADEAMKCKTAAPTAVQGAIMLILLMINLEAGVFTQTNRWFRRFYTRLVRSLQLSTDKLLFDQIFAFATHVEHKIQTSLGILISDHHWFCPSWAPGLWQVWHS